MEMGDVERRRRALHSRRICRFCLTSKEPLSDIYRNSSRGPVPLPLQVMACVAIEVFPSDSMPTTICNVCRHFMDQSYRFKQICKQGDEALRHYITHGDLRKPIEWPLDILKNLPESMWKDKSDIKDEQISFEEEKIIKTPCPPRGRPRKHAYENMNLCISSENKEPPTKIRVTQLGDDLLISTTDDVEQGEYTIREEGISMDTKEEVPTGVFPCPHCERSFPLQQLCDIHIKTHYRERSHACKHCESSFFTKYDLQKHEVTHFGNKSFQCTVCDKAFHRITLLRRHEKLHTSVPKFLCSECDETFLSEENLAQHCKKRHEKRRDYACELCPKKFAFKQGLDRHFVQHKEQAFQCNYCDLRFNTNKKLVKHVHTHAGQRPYPCKFCTKSFILSHHYTRHLRTCHLNRTKTATKEVKTEGVFAPHQDIFKCVECDETFTKQDDLIFHSAIHATQNLTCPICKDKFQNVDAVTTHIKSHAEGEQFMCEWCDLVFNSEEKLDMHIDSEHQDSMAADDSINEISYLEGKLIDESEIVETSEDSYDEEDELYDSTQQIEARTQAEVDEKDDKEFEVEVSEDGQLNLKIVEKDITIEVHSTEDAVVKIKNENEPTYAELKTVNAAEFVKSTPETTLKSSSVISKTSILSKAEETKKVTNKPIQQKNNESNDSLNSSKEKSDDQKSPKTPLKNQHSSEQREKTYNKKEPKDVSSSPKETPSRTNEKSLQLLEKDLMELKKVASGTSSDPHSSTRFLSHKPMSFRKETGANGKSPYKPLIPRKIKNETNDKETRDRDYKPVITSTPKVSKTKSSDVQDDESFMSENDNSENDGSIRRSSRPSKVKNYAALVRDQDVDSEDAGSDYEAEDDDKDDDDEVDFKQTKITKTVIPVVDADGQPVKRKRGRPRKNPPKTPVEMTPDQLKKALKRPVGRPSKKAQMERAAMLGISVDELRAKTESPLIKKVDKPTILRQTNLATFSKVSPSSPLLKKVSADMVKILPPGVKPLPLPPSAGAPPGVCQMKIGEKVVRVQKIVMTKAEVEAITKKGLLEFKDGAMVLKAGVKLPTSGDNKAIKSTLLNDPSIINKSQESSAGPSSAAASSSFSPKPEEPKPTRFGGNSPSDDENDNDND